jgi:hypothetical protein
MMKSILSSLVIVVALSGCGGKLAPLGGSTDLDAGVLLIDSGGRPVIEHIDPSSGPNSGGTTVAIRGAGFATDGGTQITFAGFPASHVTCSSESECVVLSPWAGPSSSPQVVDVQATVRGVLGDPSALSSLPDQPDVFTFTAGPSCNATQVCTELDLPQLVVTCPGQVAFYDSPWTTVEQLVGQGASYSAGTQSCGGALSACDGAPSNGSCTSFSLQAEALECGAPNFCSLCKKIAHGICSSGPDPMCCTAICQTTVPMPPCP